MSRVLLCLSLCSFFAACPPGGPGVRRPISSINCDELQPATIEAPLVEHSARVALKQDGSMLVEVGLAASRKLGGQTERKFQSYRLVSYDAAGALTQVKPTATGTTPSFAPSPDYAPEAFVAGAMHCEKAYYGFKYDEKGAERLRFLIGPYNAVKDVTLAPTGHLYVLALAQSGSSGEVTLDEAGLSIVKNYYDATFQDILLAFDPQGNQLWRRNITELDGLGGGFSLVSAPNEKALFLIAARDAARSPSRVSDIVVARYEVGKGIGQGQTELGNDVSWNGLRLGKDGALVAFGDVLTMPPALESRDIAIARINAADGTVTHSRFGSAEADFAFDASADASGAVYVVGSRGGKLTDFGGDNDAATGFVMKYDAGAVAWSRAFVDPAAGMTLTSVDVGADGTVAAAGIVNGSFSGGEFEGGRDAVVFKLDTAGNTLATSSHCACGD